MIQFDEHISNGLKPPTSSAFVMLCFCVDWIYVDAFSQSVNEWSYHGIGMVSCCLTIHPGTLTWNLQITQLKRNIIFHSPPCLGFSRSFSRVYNIGFSGWSIGSLKHGADAWVFQKATMHGSSKQTVPQILFGTRFFLRCFFTYLVNYM